MAQLTGDSADIIAYKILLSIARNEKKSVTNDDDIVADKTWILATLREIYAIMNTLVRK
jgi:hypothetical protein